MNKLKILIVIVECNLSNNDDCSNDIAEDRNPFTETSQLFIEWSFHSVLNLNSTKYLSVLGGVAHCFHFHISMSFQHIGSSEHVIAWESGSSIKIRLYCSFVANWFTSQRRFIHLQIRSFEQCTIGGNLITR